MKTTVVFLSVVILSLSFAALAAADDSVQGPQVILQAREKEPGHARNLALWPIFGPIMGANYAGHTPTSMKLPTRLRNTALIYSLVNVGEVFGMAGAGYAIGLGQEPIKEEVYTEPDGDVITDREVEQGQRWYWLGYGAGLGVLSAVVTNIFAGRVYADHCVKYNRALYEKFKWEPPIVSMNGRGDAFVAMSLRFK